MIMLHWVINIVRLVLVMVVTIICAILVMTLMLVTFGNQQSLKFVGHYIWGPGILFCCGVRIKVHGIENISKEEAGLYISNHESQIDIPVIFKAIPLAMHFVAKKELAKVPFLGWAIWASGMIFIDRSNRNEAMSSMKTAGELIKKGKNVISFPEGTRSKSGKIGTFKRGSFVIAQSADVGITPVGLVGAKDVLPSGSFLIRPGIVNVIIGKRFYPKDYPNASAEELSKIGKEKVLELISLYK